MVQPINFRRWPESSAKSMHWWTYTQTPDSRILDSRLPSQDSRLKTPDFLRRQPRLICRYEFDELRHLDHVFADEPDGVRAGPLDIWKVAQHLDRPVVLKADVKLHRHLDLVRFEFTDPLERRRRFFADQLFARLGQQGPGGMESDCAFYCGALDGTEQVLGLLNDSVIARDHYHRHSKLARNRCVDAGLRNRPAVQADIGQVCARDRMGPNSRRIISTRMIADEHHTGEARVDAFHHPERPGEPADQRQAGVRH